MGFQQRFIDSVDLFGASFGGSTCGDFVCDICKTRYNEGADDEGDKGIYDGDSVTYTEFAGLFICYECFLTIENEVLHRMPDILAWYKKILEARKKQQQEDESVLAAVTG